MYGRGLTNRRTVLKTVAATVAGGGIATGMAPVDRYDSGGASKAPNLVEITAAHGPGKHDHEFTLSADEIPAGWTTFELSNATAATHFVYVAKLPQTAIEAAAGRDQTVLDQYVERVTRPFQWLVDQQVPGKESDPDDRFSDETLFPPWFADVRPLGGVGLTSPHRTAATSIALSPGEYVVECYLKDANNDLHSYHGMIERLSVTGTQRGGPPAATTGVTLSTDGIDAPQSIRPGKQTVAVQFRDQVRYSNALGHDLHLLRLDEDTTVADVTDWMNYMDPDQFISDGSEPGTFLGGVQDMLTPALLDGTGTRTAYVHLDLLPGDYAWVSEIPAPATDGYLTQFTVPFGTGESD